VATQTAQSIASLAAGAGFTGSQVAIATAIALAESGGNPDSVGDNGTSFGLWQIHVPAHPEFKGVNLFDPATNAHAAYTVYQHQGWGAWSTYNGAAYFKALPAAQAAAGGATLASVPFDPAGTARNLLDQTGAVETATSAITQAGAVTGFIEQLADPATWLRVGKVVIGAVVIMVGVGLVVKLAADDTGVTAAAKKTASTATKVAAVAAK